MDGVRFECFQHLAKSATREQREADAGISGTRYGPEIERRNGLHRVAGEAKIVKGGVECPNHPVDLRLPSIRD
jgi:hypothetical protein